MLSQRNMQILKGIFISEGSLASPGQDVMCLASPLTQLPKGLGISEWHGVFGNSHLYGRPWVSKKAQGACQTISVCTWHSPKFKQPITVYTFLLGGFAHPRPPLQVGSCRSLRKPGSKAQAKSAAVAASRCGGDLRGTRPGTVRTWPIHFSPHK